MESPVPPPFREVPRKRSGPVILIAGVLVGIALMAVYALVNPTEAAWMPKCLFHELTGWQCAGCGAQRLFHALLTGHPADAFLYNPFLFCMLPLILFLLWLELTRKKHQALYAKVYSPAACYSMGAAIILWTILRNVF